MEKISLGKKNYPMKVEEFTDIGLKGHESLVSVKLYMYIIL
jgi:hypothetical protein